MSCDPPVQPLPSFSISNFFYPNLDSNPQVNPKNPSNSTSERIVKFKIEGCQSLAILSSTSNSNQSSINPPISALISLIFNHHQQYKQAHNTPDNQGGGPAERLPDGIPETSIQRPLILLLTGRERDGLKDAIKQIQDGFDNFHTERSKADEGKGEHWFKTLREGGKGLRDMQEALRDLEIRYFPSPLHLLTFLSLIRSSLPISIPEHIGKDFKIDDTLNWLPRTSNKEKGKEKAQDGRQVSHEDRNGEGDVEMNESNRQGSMEAVENGESREVGTSETQQQVGNQEGNQEDVETARPIPDFRSKSSSNHERVLLFNRKPTLIVLEGLGEMLERNQEVQPSQCVETLSTILAHTIDLVNHLSSTPFNSKSSSLNTSISTQLVLFDQKLGQETFELPIIPSYSNGGRGEEVKIPAIKVVERTFGWIVDFKVESSGDEMEVDDQYASTSSMRNRNGKGKLILRNGFGGSRKREMDLNLKALKELKEETRMRGDGFQEEGIGFKLEMEVSSG